MKLPLQQHLAPFAIAALMLPLAACSESSNAPSSDTSASETTPGTTPGTLIVKANGEDFVRQGFTDKDGWQISFDHVYVTLGEVVAAQSDPPFEAGKGEPISATEKVVTGTPPITVDLAEGGPDAETIVVAEISDAPSGRYNALAWELVPAPAGPAEGYPLVMIGSATKDGETIVFNIQMDEAVAFSCGDFIGDERKGVLEGDTAEIEATFHFDHIFGDGEAAADDEINTGALGFDALAAVADSGELSVTSTELQQQLTEADYNKLEKLISSLGHVGEGHCEATQIEA